MNSVWRTAGTGRLVLVLTFLATLVLSVPAAVTIGIIAAIALYLYSSASHVQVRALEPQDDGKVHVVDVPDELPGRSITVLEVYGSLFFAAAKRLGELLPEPGDADRPVVILRLRGNSQVGATVIDVLNDYAHELGNVGGRLYLNGMDEQVSKRLERARRFDLDEGVVLFPATDILGESTRHAIAHANDWLRPYREDEDDALVWPGNVLGEIGG
jgi:SulP family sulfate permease